MNKRIVLFSFVLLGCGVREPKPLQDFFPGTYVRTFAHEFARGEDSIIISTRDGQQYQMLKKSGFQRIKNDRLLGKEFHQEKWTGLFNAQKQVIIENKTGKVLQVDRSTGGLTVGASEYQKIK